MIFIKPGRRRIEKGMDVTCGWPGWRKNKGWAG